MSESTPAVSLGALLGWLRGRTSCLWHLEARLKGARLEGRSQFLGRPIISVAPNSTMTLGAGLRCYSAVRANPLACFQPCVLRTMLPGASLTLDRNVGLSGAVLCAAKGISVGEGTIFGSGAMVMDNDFHVPGDNWGWDSDLSRHPAAMAEIIIGRGVFVGARAMILKGVKIGDRAVIGAGAVVTRDVPPEHFAVGNPARILPPKPLQPFDDAPMVSGA